MNIIVAFDAWSIAETEKICQAIQRLTGVSNHRLYGFVTLLSTLALLDISVGIIFSNTILKSSIFVALSIDAPFLYWSVVLTGLIDSLFSFYREKEAFAMVQSGCSNPSKINPLHMFVRVICILNLMIITVFYFSGVVGSVYDLFVIATFVAGSLIFACDPLPPSDGKIKDWLKSFRSRGLKQLIPQNIKP